MKLRVNFSDMPYGFDIYNNCYYRNLSKLVDIEISEDPELLFYGPFGTEFLKYKKCILVFLADEPVLPNFNDCDYAVGSIDMRLGNRYFLRPPITGYGEISDVSLLSKPREVNRELLDRKFCNFVYSNESNGNGATLRKQFCMNLSEYKQVDCPGVVLNNMENVIEDRYCKNGYDKGRLNDNWINSKINFLKNYKFTIAFENVRMDGWTTEKLMHPFFANSIPIYWGNSKVADFFNTKAFIDCNKYDNDLTSVMKRIIELDNDDEQYLWMLKQSPIHAGYDAEWEDKLVAFFKYIMANGRVEKNPIGFSSMSATDYPTLYRQGKIGLKSMITMNVKCISGWMEYKIKRRKEV